MLKKNKLLSSLNTDEPNNKWAWHIFTTLCMDISFLHKTVLAMTSTSLYGYAVYNSNASTCF